MNESTEPTDDEQAEQPPVAPLRIRYRIRFHKTGLLRWISHRDLARLWERIIRRAALKPSMTEGFHPKPRIGFPSALALGVESLDEVVELDLAENLSPSELLQRLAADNQPGLLIKSVCRLPEGFGKAQLQSTEYTISMPSHTAADRDQIRDAIARIKQQATVSIQRKKKQVVANVAEQIPVIDLQDSHLALSLAATDSASLKPHDVLDLLGLDDWIENGALIVRTRVVLQKEFEFKDTNEFALGSDSSPDSITEY